MINTIVHGDCLEVLPTLDEQSVDLVCTDPPYGLAFMGKDWDRALPPIEIWRECLRVLKPGAFAFVLCTPRQDCLVRMICNLEDAGFVVGFTSIYWAYASGFPKAQNLSKAVDKRAEHKHGPACTTVDGGCIEMCTTEAKALDGAYGGFQPKPAVEVILVVMKPPTHGTWLDQALDNGKGCTWLDDGRIPTRAPRPARAGLGRSGNPVAYDLGSRSSVGDTMQGRFPANLIVQDGAVDDGRERVSIGGNRAQTCLDKPSAFGTGSAPPSNTGLGDSGTFSRYFSLDAWWAKRLKELPAEVKRTFPFLLVPKASSGEKNRGLKTARPQMDPSRRPGFENPYNRGGIERRNNHPTVKPLKLMAWLITIGSRPGDLVMDPFVGSGSTTIAAKIMDRKWIGIERDKNYHDLASARIEGHRWSQADLEKTRPQLPAVLPGQMGLFDE